MAYEGFYRGVQPVGRLFRNNDIIPILGFGTGTGYFERPAAVAEGILLAFNAGYRLIDTAQVNDNLIYITNHHIAYNNVYFNIIINFFLLQAYGTEAGVGEGLAALIEGGVKRPDGGKITRQDLFLESKVKDHGVGIPKFDNPTCLVDSNQTH